MTYQPNFNDPRVIKKIKSALGFVGACISDTKSHPWSTRYIDKHLGQQQHELGNYLRGKLLTCTNERYSKDSGKCKEYIKNSTGYNELVSLLSKSLTYPSVSQVSTQLITDWAKDEFSEELKTKNFKYEDKSSRYWHNLQRIRRDYKRIIFIDSGLKYQYDIQCCAPTLIYQYSTMLDDPNDLYLEAISSYINDRKSVRTKLATNAEIPEKMAKEIINALLMGAKLGLVIDSAIYQLLDGDKSRIEYLKQDPFITKYREELKLIWDYIKPTMRKTTIIDKNNKIRTLPISCKQKAGLYFDLEKRVLNSVRNYMDITNNQYFLEHDGWVCTKAINQQELVQHIKNSTGFDVILDSEVLC